MGTAFFLLVAAAIGGLILSEKIKDGVIIKAGLITVALGYIGAASMVYQGDIDTSRPLYAIGTGCLICITGIVLRGLSSRGKCRRLSDWIDQHSEGAR